jgi:hypothetical protein
LKEERHVSLKRLQAESEDGSALEECRGPTDVLRIIQHDLDEQLLFGMEAIHWDAPDD